MRVSVQPENPTQKEVVVSMDPGCQESTINLQNWWTENSNEGKLYVNKRTKYSGVLNDFDLNW